MNDNIYDQLLTNANYNINYSRFPGSRIALTWEFEQVKQKKVAAKRVFQIVLQRARRFRDRATNLLKNGLQTCHSRDPFVCIVFRSLSTERNQSQSKKSERI